MEAASEPDLSQRLPVKREPTKVPREWHGRNPGHSWPVGCQETVEELVEVFRAIRGEDHPDWADYRASMVADRRLVATLSVEAVYGLARPQYAKPA